MTPRIYCPRALKICCQKPARIALAIEHLATLAPMSDEDAEDAALLACGPCGVEAMATGGEIDILPASDEEREAAQVRRLMNGVRYWPPAGGGPTA